MRTTRWRTIRLTLFLYVSLWVFNELYRTSATNAAHAYNIALRNLAKWLQDCPWDNMSRTLQPEYVSGGFGILVLI